MRRRKNEGLFPPAAAIICGTLAGLCFWDFLAPETVLCGAAFWVTALVAIVFLSGVFLLRRNAPPRRVFFSRESNNYRSVSYLRYRYGIHLYRLGLLALFCMGFWHGFLWQMPLENSIKDLLSRSIPGASYLIPAGEQVFLCLRVTDFPVHVTTGSGREYMRMECRLVLYSPDGRQQVYGNENIQVYVLVDTTGGSLMRKAPTQWLPGDILITRCRTFPFSTYQPASTTDSALTTSATRGIGTASAPSETTIIDRDTGTGSVNTIELQSSVPDSASTNNTTFDYSKYMARRGFYRRAYIYQYQRVTGKLTVFERLKRLRVPLTRYWEGEAGALLSGICLGDKSGLTRETRDKFSVAGAGHILAVSGLHVGILYGSLVLLLGLPLRIRESRRYKHKRTRQSQKVDSIPATGVPELAHGSVPMHLPENNPATIYSRELALRRTYSLTLGTWIHIPALLLIWTYAAVVGFSASVLRAALMLTIYGIGKMTGRRALGLNVLSLTAMILVTVEPMNLYDIGFQMSFSAVLGLILFFPLLRNLLSVRSRPLKYIWELFCCSLAVQLGTLWLTSASFGIIPLYGLLCNLVVVPFCTIILYVFLCYLIVLGFSGLWGLSLHNVMPGIRIPVAEFSQAVLQSLNEVLHHLAGWLENTVSFFADLPLTPIHYQPGPGGQILILFCTAIVYILLRRNDRNF